MYRDQRHSVDAVAALAPTHSITVVAIHKQKHDLVLAPGLHSIAAPRAAFTEAFIADLFRRVRPDLFICRTPFVEVLAHAKKNSVRTLPVFADIFENTNLRMLVQNLRLRQVLTGAHISCVSNHSLNASRSMARALFYPARRILPWDWRRIEAVEPPKSALARPDQPRAFFAGKLTPDKGVDDCLVALGKVRAGGLDLSITFAGQGDLDSWKTRAEALGVAGSAHFIGTIPNTDVSTQMRAHDIVLVPSRHSYPEGMPNTIYEGLASRSPLVVSDHPAFRGRITDGQGCMVFAGSNPESLAATLKQLCGDQALYARLSANSETALNSLYIGIEWSHLITQFIADPENTSRWADPNSLKALALTR
ncbi:glycosyltransferase family 4 protein [Roseobacter sp. YSTF-M11]|uniref:Glycosyltransferase family 4 protein n=1 Tax=Roseobacter insulae TaxID=2859783 RepID=A0A9X1FYZ6_9RHOB|nr:glycosyltransferase family 4 protein [Roseobacter insulae]MBW4710795.1 glycosyltransferase family 4 protein [Roseobacter insulae]